MIKTVPLWRDEFPRPADLPTTELPEQTEVAIVGAGFTGLNAARVLRHHGIDVTVIDAGQVGAGASSVNGGMVNYGLKAATTKVYKMFGPELGRQFWDASLDSIDLVEEVVSSLGIDCSLQRRGAAELGYNRRDHGEFEKEAEWMERNLDFKVELVGPDRVHSSVVGSDAFHAALIDQVGAGLQPAKYVFGLANALAGLGASIVEEAPVTSIARNGTGYRLTTPKGSLNAHQVLMATNGYTGPLIPELQRRVVPVGSYIVVTEPLPEVQAERLIPHNRMIWTARRFLNYFRRTPDNRILLGGRNKLTTKSDLLESAHILRQTTVGIFPELDKAEFTHSWTGRLAVTFDLMPHIGQIDGVWYAMGYGGHGVGIGTYVGTEVGKLLAGEIDSSPFAEIPHPTRWFYRKRPWFLPLAASWYRFLDWIGR